MAAAIGGVLVRQRRLTVMPDREASATTAVRTISTCEKWPENKRGNPKRYDQIFSMRNNQMDRQEIPDHFAEFCPRKPMTIGNHKGNV